MSALTQKRPKSPIPKPILDENIGLLRRFLRGRIWYGTEWYITVIGGSILFIILSLTIAAPWVSPYDPNDFVGAPFVEPGQGPQILISLTAETGTFDINSLADETIGVHRNRSGDKLADNLEIEKKRYQTQEELIAGFELGEINYIFLDEGLEAEILAQYPNMHVIARDLGVRFPLGTDNLGRDLVSRLIWGARTVLTVAISSALISSTIGVSLGLFSGYVSGRLDRILSLIMDSIYSFPGLLLAITMVAMLGPSIINVAIAVSVIYIPTFFRIVRGQVLSIKEELYVEAARSLGAKSSSILWSYIFPNIIPSIVVVFSLNIGDAILTEAGLSFIGLGLPPDIPDWGYDLAKGHGFLVAGRWWLITYPGIMITLVATGFTLLGEGLSEILNPRLVKN